MQKELNLMRMQLADRTEEIEKNKLMILIEIDRAREMGYHKAEQRLLESIKVKEAKHHEEKVALT